MKPILALTIALAITAGTTIDVRPVQAETAATANDAIAKYVVTVSGMT